MIIKNASYRELAERIKKTDSRVIVYGAGTIGRVLVPVFLGTYELYSYVSCYVDRDRRKTRIQVGHTAYPVEAPDILREVRSPAIVLITNSNFYPVVELLDSIPALDQVEGYIIPVMQLQEFPSADQLAVQKLTREPVIPKKIHYTWFSKEPMPAFLQDCVGTWKKLCPDYEIIHWNLDNYDVSRIPYARDACAHKKYGFLADAARLDILYQHGGIYMDVDVSLLKNLDELLYQEGFIGFEKWGVLNAGGCCGAVPRHPMIKKMLDLRRDVPFVLEDGSLNTEPSGWFETAPFVASGLRLDNSLQRIENMTVYPSGVFHPYDYMSCESRIKPYTVSQHHFYGGWLEREGNKGRKKNQERYYQMIMRMGIRDGRCGHAV